MRKIKLIVPFEYSSKQIVEKDKKWRKYRDVPIAYEGTFTDGLSNTPWHFSKSALKEYADNWEEKYLDIDHRIDSALHRVGFVKPKGWKDGAVRVDLKILRVTQNAKDIIASIDAGLVNDVSVEVSTDDIEWDYDDRCYHVNEMTFTGVGIVTHAAMPECRDVLE